VRRRISLRRRLILLSWSLAVVTAVLVSALLHHRAHRQLLAQVEKALETKCDEIITLLRAGAPHPSLQDFLQIETSYRYTPYTYFYLIRDGWGRVVARSVNLEDHELPLPSSWGPSDHGTATFFSTESHPVHLGFERVLVRTERIEIPDPGAGSTEFLIQVAVTLAPLETTMRANLRDTLVVTAVALLLVLFLLWFAATRALRPVTAMTRKASQITATNPRERLPLAGRDDELDELATVLNDMLDRLGASLRQMEQFSSNAAHQVRTPLTRIRGELDLVMASGGIADPQRSQLEGVQGELERLSRVCGRLLLLARLDQQTRDESLFVDRVDLEEVVEELLEQMCPVARDRGVQLRHGSSSPLCVRGSRPLLVEAMLNLLDNAIRFTPANGAVVVRVEARGSRACLSVEDGGPGIPAAERDSVFLPFHRREPAGARDDGSGLGLAIVRGIARAHGGRVDVEEASGGGSVFRLELPALPAH